MNQRPRDHETADWPSWIDRQRYYLGAAVFLLFFLLYGLLVYTAGTRPLSPLEQTSLALIGIVVSAALGVLLGVPFAKRRIRIGSQLRRAYGIDLALKTVCDDLGAAGSRMKDRRDLAPNALNDFWDEITKSTRSSLRLLMLEAERIVEDWGEFDPNERARIRDEERQRKEDVDQISREIEAAESVKSDLQEAAADSDTSRPAIERLAERIRELHAALERKGEAYVPGTARSLLNRGDYAKAVEAYTQMIRQYPTVHTNYIGRARARFLAGDRPGALEDLAKAESMFSDDPAIEIVRRQVVAGDLPAPQPVEAKSESAQGNLKLALGNAAEAAGHYERAQTLGWDPGFCRFNLAMAACVGGNPAKARELLAAFAPDAGSYAQANSLALAAICDLDLGEDPAQHLGQLGACIKTIGQYEFSRSPLRFLRSGLRNADTTRAERAEKVFTVLERLPEQQAEPTEP